MLSNASPLEAVWTVASLVGLLVTLRNLWRAWKQERAVSAESASVRLAASQIAAKHTILAFINAFSFAAGVLALLTTPVGAPWAGTGIVSLLIAGNVATTLLSIVLAAQELAAEALVERESHDH